MPEFGDFVQRVLCKLVTDHHWDDPYASLSPQYDSSGEILNMLFKAYQEKNQINDTISDVKTWIASVAFFIDNSI